MREVAAQLLQVSEDLLKNAPGNYTDFVHLAFILLINNRQSSDSDSDEPVSENSLEELLHRKFEYFRYFLSHLLLRQPGSPAQGARKEGEQPPDAQVPGEEAEERRLLRDIWVDYELAQTLVALVEKSYAFFNLESFGNQKIAEFFGFQYARDLRRHWEQVFSREYLIEESFKYNNQIKSVNVLEIQLSLLTLLIEYELVAREVENSGGTETALARALQQYRKLFKLVTLEFAQPTPHNRQFQNPNRALLLSMVNFLYSMLRRLAAQRRPSQLAAQQQLEAALEDLLAFMLLSVERVDQLNQKLPSESAGPLLNLNRVSFEQTVRDYMGSPLLPKGQISYLLAEDLRPLAQSVRSEEFFFAFLDNQELLNFVHNNLPINFEYVRDSFDLVLNKRFVVSYESVSQLQQRFEDQNYRFFKEVRIACPFLPILVHSRN